MKEELTPLRRLLNEEGLKPKHLTEGFGNNRNTTHKWLNTDTDVQIPLGKVISFMKLYPHIDLSKYLPSIKKIVEQARKFVEQDQT